ncbi:hypothetical protein N9N28_17800 [Rubripirellula amarantea]|uniref:RNA polymerase sigma factor n=1 Tax=Rubripirellula amarantea TaxID=2527999 RepID=A0A5C5WSI2_9BACT|nr:hypothetical protein [Rubripirellula amarantea]MDA8746481.1 hypothetical protein [Rubripirellula amarantea]TWT53105.1 hypothetical protein Pla22_07330 [Rubripirellula amarantea]
MSDINAAKTVTGRSTVNLVRSSHPWTEADSAAGFVLRYLVPMRRQLTAIMGASELADNALKLLLAHLVSVGFGDHKRGRLRDFLIRGVRSAAKTAANELPEAKRPVIDLESVTLESKEWLTFWREGLLERAWRSLERIEHAHPEKPFYTILQGATSSTPKTPSVLAAQIATEAGIQISEAKVQELLVEARTTFAQLIADEVAETLEDPSSEDVKREIALLGLGKAFAGIAV